MRMIGAVMGYLAITAGLVFLGLAILVLRQFGLSVGFFGALLTGCVGIGCGFSLLLRSRGLMID
jgi:hypothetical protein